MPEKKAVLVVMSSRCRSYIATPSQMYVPVYTPIACPDPVNLDPKRNEIFCKQAQCRSEPLSHSEYLRKLVENNGVGISRGTLLQQGTGVYKTTNWMATSGPCLRNTPVPPAQPFVSAGLNTEIKGAMASRGTRSLYDSVNTNDESTTNRRGGQAIAADKGCNTCTLAGYNGTGINCGCTRT